MNTKQDDAATHPARTQGGECCVGEHNGFGVQCDDLCECSECVQQHGEGE